MDDDAKMARVLTGLVTYADLQQMPDDGRQYELYDGEVRVVPSPNNRHQFVLQNFVALFLEHQRQHGGRVLFAPSDVVFSEHNVIQPDLLYFVESRRDLVPIDRPTESAPDLTVEVMSPGTSRHDRTRKKAMYARFGVREYWIVDPLAETIEVFVLDGREYRRAQVADVAETAVSPTVEGLRAAAAVVFDIA